MKFLWAQNLMIVRIHSTQFHNTREIYMNNLLHSSKQSGWHCKLHYKPHTWKVVKQGHGIKTEIHGLWQCCLFLVKKTWVKSCFEVLMLGCWKGFDYLFQSFTGYRISKGKIIYTSALHNDQRGLRPTNDLICLYCWIPVYVSMCYMVFSYQLKSK